MLGKNRIVAIRLNKRYIFYKNRQNSFLDVISTDSGLARKYKGVKIRNVWSEVVHTYVLHELKLLRRDVMLNILNTLRRKWI